MEGTTILCIKLSSEGLIDKSMALEGRLTHKCLADDDNCEVRLDRFRVPHGHVAGVFVALIFDLKVLWGELRRQLLIDARMEWAILGLGGEAAAVVDHWDAVVQV